MAELNFKSAGVSTQEIDLSGPVAVEPQGVPAGVIGTSVKGPAFVPVTIGLIDDYFAKFGPSDGKKFGPLAVNAWLKNQSSATFIKVLGIGKGEKRLTSGDNAGSVESAGFVVGERQPNQAGAFVDNPYANANGVPGRTFFLGAYMSDSLGSSYLTDAGLQGAAGVMPNVSSSVPIVRGILMAASGVIPRLSSSRSGFSSAAPSSTYIAVNSTTNGAITGTVVLSENSIAKQEFVMLLNGHKGTDSNYPNHLTASFDPTAQNYFGKVLNRNPLKIQEAGHYLYASWDIHPALATVTGTSVINPHYGASGISGSVGKESAAFLTTGSFPRNQGSATVPSYENFEDRFRNAKTPYVVSQKFGGTPADLFYFEALDDGEYAGGKVKLSIENIGASNDDKDRFGTFDVVVRDIRDRDDNKILLEEFRGLSLNPNSDRYIAKVIGDQKAFYDFDKSNASQKLVVNGNYPNKSNYIRVVISARLEAEEIDDAALPMGFRGIAHLVTSGTQPLTDNSAPVLGNNLQTENWTPNLLKRVVQAPLPLKMSVTKGSGPKKQADSSVYWGAQFERADAADELNKSTLFDDSMLSFGKYFPDFQTTNQNFVVGANAGVADTAANAILDSDRFNNNLFTLENVKIKTGSGNIPDMTTVADWLYVRRGGIVSDETNKTRALATTDLTNQSVKTFAKFTMPMQGGFDGVNLFDEDEANLTNNAIVEELNFTARGLNSGPTISSYRKALRVAKDTSIVDIKLLAIPGIKHSTFTDEAIVATEERFDALYIMDMDSYDNVNSLITSSNQPAHVANTVLQFKNRALDSNFACTFFPDVVVRDPSLNTLVTAPSSIAALEALGLNDRIGFPWFAPAGFSRGALESVVETTVALNKSNRDALYDADINPIVSFPNSGSPVIFGQKTLQAAQTALDRINVRRLLVELRRQVREVANTFLFEPNKAATLARFTAAVNPRLQAIQQRSGIERFKVLIDTTTTTQLDVENNTIRGKIYVQPTRTVEFVSIDFVVTNAGTQIA